MLKGLPGDRFISHAETRFAFQPTGLAVLTQIRQDSSDAVGGARGVGVLVAQNPAHAGKSLLAELTRPLILAQPPQRDGKAVSRAQGVGMVVAPDLAHASEGVFAELTCLLILAQPPQSGGEAVGRTQRCRDGHRPEPGACE